jgi:DNA replication protein DnaC
MKNSQRTDIQDAISDYCRILRLPQVAVSFEEEALNASKTKMSYQEYLYALLQHQVLIRTDNSINARIKKARFPFIKTLEEFDFSFQPQIDEKLLRELSNLNFLSDAQNLLFIGPPGVGKTHMAIALGMKAAQVQKRVLFYTAENLIDELAAAEVSGRLPSFLDIMGRVDLLIIDELGYLKLTRQSAELFFKLIAKRYEKGSVIVTSNKAFEQWGEIFVDDVVAAAILDRLLHHSYPFFIQGKSYRMKNIKGH